MAKIKKNYAISGDVVELLNEVARLLNMKQGEVIECLAIRYAPVFYDDMLKAKVEDIETLQRLSDMAGMAAYNIDREEEGAL